ncbi:hypothetical protein [Deinococcus humi]|uniref:Uncharacterized protein n=1 Tax=Deinococcus humi TaxID=662880 RepID=A0A7W8JR26_9DEIO|nr:hypothetical protein [Deinococcus humi]MBB5361375.1 hypothetical protein [Deinococcus humi]
MHFYEVTLIAPAPTTSGPYMAQHHPDGTLTLTPVQEAEKVEERREPEFGEVWQMRDERLVLIASDHRTDFRPWPIVLNHEGTGPVIPAEETYATRALGAGNLTFAYSSLAAAVAAGAIK